jgi:hypothetical protein
MPFDPPRPAAADVSEPQPKKPFHEPRLVRYGDIGQISQSVGKMGSMDTGGMGQMVKTR